MKRRERVIMVNMGRIKFQNQLSVKTLGTLAKILHFLTYSCLLLKLDKILFILASDKPLEFLESILGKSLIKSVKRMNKL